MGDGGGNGGGNGGGAILSSGELDISFDSDGLVTTDLGGSTEGANGVIIDSSLRVVVAGFTSNNGLVQRYLSDGNDRYFIHSVGIRRVG